MLFISFIENYFKHGIDKNKKNQLDIDLNETEGFIRFAISNDIQNPNRGIDKGVGLDNIQKRLELLFGKRFTLDVKIENNKFNVLLTFPILYEYSMPGR